MHTTCPAFNACPYAGDHCLRGIEHCHAPRVSARVTLPAPVWAAAANHLSGLLLDSPPSRFTGWTAVALDQLLHEVCRHRAMDVRAEVSQAA